MSYLTRFLSGYAAAVLASLLFAAPVAAQVRIFQLVNVRASTRPHISLLPCEQ